MNAPVIHVWHGMRQVFGRPGITQRWVNVLGRIEHAHLDEVTLASWLNAGAQRPIAIGPDGRRLESRGDFNIDIHVEDLVAGENTLRIEARHNSGEAAIQDVQLVFVKSAWPLPYDIAWRNVTDPHSVVQVIDGEWSFSEAGARSATPGYDRIIGLGDAGWQNHEIIVPITVHTVDPQGFANPNSTAPGLGIVTRWHGHTDTPVKCGQPLCGYLPSGAQSWFDWGDNGGTLFLFGSQPGFLARDATGFKLNAGDTVIWKHRVEEQVGGTHHHLKVWRAGEREPDAWILSAFDNSQPPINPSTGSTLLLAHHVDVTFGDIKVTA